MLGYLYILVSAAHRTCVGSSESRDSPSKKNWNLATLFPPHQKILQKINQRVLFCLSAPIILQTQWRKFKYLWYVGSTSQILSLDLKLPLSPSLSVHWCLHSWDWWPHAGNAIGKRKLKTRVARRVLLHFDAISTIVIGKPVALPSPIPLLKAGSFAYHR